ncbi:MAG: LptF/LptG family permease [Pirellulales bacterium]|nr:LptF/LptG family permease [Pirellulales bacterium]
MRLGIIDRYLLRQFVQTFVICFLSLTGLYIVFDAFTNLESFLRVKNSAGGLGQLMASYYACRSLYFFDLTAGMLALIAAMFTMTWIQRHNEMTALMAAGISRIRVVLPVVAAAAAIALVATANRELVIPQLRQQLARDPSDPTGENARGLEARFDAQTDILIGGKASVAGQKQIVEPSFVLPPTLGEYGLQLDAEEAFYHPPEGDRPGGYLLKGVQRPKELATCPSLTLGGKPIIITPRDAPGWLAQDECFVVSDVSFDLLTRGLENASTAELIAGLRNPSVESGADDRVRIHSRILRPLTDLTLLCLGLPLVLTRENRNVFVAIGLCVLVVTIYVVVTITFHYLGNSYWISPQLSAWAPVLLFAPLAAWLAGAAWE